MAEHSNIQKPSQPDQITVKQGILKVKTFNRYLLTRWKLIILVSVIGGAIGLVYALTKKTSYTAEYTFVIDEGNSSSGGGLGQYSELASMAGIDIGNSSGLFQGDNIMELYKSRSMVEKTLLTRVSINGQPRLLIDEYIHLHGLDKQWEGNPDLRNIGFDTLKGKFNIRQDSVIILIADQIDKMYLSVDKPDKKLSIISVKFKDQNPFFAKAFTETIVNNVNTFYIETKTAGSLKNVRLFQHQTDSIRRVITSSLHGAASAIESNPDPDPSLANLRVPAQNKAIDVQANTVLYGEAVKNLEVARAALQRETPLIQVVDAPMLPLPNDGLSKAKGIMIGAVIAFFVITAVVSFHKLYTYILT